MRNAAVKNLNIQGDHIDGYGLVERYIVDYGEDGKYISATAAKHRTIDIENVTPEVRHQDSAIRLYWRRGIRRKCYKYPQLHH